MMDLKDFVAESIDQILLGIGEVKKRHGNVIPTMRILPEKSHEPRGSGGNPIDLIEFDIAVSTAESSEDKVGGGIKVLNFINVGLNASTQKELQSSTVSRIKFSVPVHLNFAKASA